MKKIANIHDDMHAIICVTKDDLYLASKKIDFDIEKISLAERYARLYSKKVGFTPYINERGYHHMGAEIGYYGQVRIGSFTTDIINCVTNGGCGSYNVNTDNIFDIFSFEEIFDGLEVITRNFKNNTMELIKSRFSVKDGEIYIEKVDKVTVFFDSGMKFERSGELISIEEIATFFSKNVCYFSREDFHDFAIKQIYNSFSSEKGFEEIYQEYKNFLRSSRNIAVFSDYDFVSYYYYASSKSYYLICEHFIKNNAEKTIHEHNTVFSGKPIPAVKELHSLSKISQDILKETRNYDDYEFVKILTAMEEDSKIGVNNIKMIYDVYKLCKDINIYQITSTGRVETCFGYIYKIMENFDVTPKVLIERAIRAALTEGTSLAGYLSIVIDYYEMCKSLGIDYERKIPKDVITRHNILQTQIQAKKNEETKRQFARTSKFNQELLKNVPENANYTILSPEVPDDLIVEGTRMHHCVGSYIDRYAVGSSKIFFIRRKEDINAAFVTVELDKYNNLVQAKAKNNDMPEKQCLEFINEWVKSIGGIYE